MKIAIGPYGGGSGISTYTSELCKALATVRNDLDVTLLTWQGIDYPDAKFPTMTLPKNAFLGMSDYTGGPFAKVMMFPGTDVPMIHAGSDARFFLLAGTFVGENALLRFYVLHCVFIPVIATVLIAVHFWRIRKDGGISGPL